MKEKPKIVEKKPLVYTFKLMENSFRDEDITAWKSTKPMDVVIIPYSAWKKMKENYVRKK